MATSSFALNATDRIPLICKMDRARRPYVMKQKKEKFITIIPSQDAQRKFTISADILYGSPVLKDYIDQSDTVPPEVARNGAGTLTFNTSSDAMCTLLEHLKKHHGSTDYVEQNTKREPLFYMQLYKFALCLAMDDLCAIALDQLRTKTKTAEDFLGIALEASRSKLVEERRFRVWFVSLVRKRHDDFLKAFDVDNDEARICSILVTTLALVAEDIKVMPIPVPRPPIVPLTPPSTGSRKRKGARVYGDKSYGLSDSAAEELDVSIGRDEGKSKKRKFQTKVEDASDVD